MIAAAIDKILSMGRNEIFDAEGGATYTSKVFYPVKSPEPAALQTKTLSSVVTYLVEDADGLEATAKGRMIIHIVNDHEVRVGSALIKPFEQRNTYLCATFDQSEIFQFGKYYDAERFVVGLQSLFVQDENTAVLLRMVGNIQNGLTRKTTDDGISQTIRTKVSISSAADVKVPNPVPLRPYRTFCEIDQPESQFVLRLRSCGEDKPPEIALFEADNGAWRNIAMASINQYLEEALGGKPVIILM